jgi:peptide/nickel transport system permease protein
MQNFALFFIRRLAVMIVTVFAIATITFILMRLVPGDPFQDEQGLPTESLAMLRSYYGLDDPKHG